MKNIFFNWNKIVSNKVFLFSFFLFSSQINFAQCTISSFTVAPTNATCFSNGQIKVSIPTGQSGCETRFATLTPVTGSSNTPIPSQTQTLTFSSTGGEVVFSSLPAGKYNIATSDGITTNNYASNPVTITSSYTPMTLNLSSTAPTCAAGTTGYVANGTFTATVVGGTGPFEYTLTSASGVQTFSSASRTQVFNTIQAGETVTIVVTDKVNNNPGCQVSVTQTHVTSTAVPAPLAYGLRAYNFIRDCSDPVQSKIKFYVNLDNLTADRLSILQQNPLNAKITIAGQDYPLTYVPARNGYTYEPATVNGPELEHGDSITTSFNWGCSTLTRTSLVHMPNDWFNFTPTTVSDANCNLQLRLRIFGDQDHTQGGITDRNIYFCPTNTVKIERRVSISPEKYEEVTSPNISPDPYASTNDLNVILNPSNPTIPSSSSDWFLNEGGYYKITVSDASHTVINYYNAPNPLVNPVSTLTINPTASLLSGTSGFNIPLLGAGVKYPLTVKVERTDGLTTVNHTATQPLNLAGTYTYNFPMVVTWNSSPDAYGSVYDLPPGEYRFTISDACSNTNSVTKVLTSTNPFLASYNPTFTVTQGCNNSNSIAFSLNRNGFAFGSNWTPSPDVYLYTKSATGGLGTYLRSVARTNNLAASGTFSNLASGSYFIQFNGIGLGYSAALKTFSPPPLNYIKEITIPDYQNFTVSTGASICDALSANTGIISAQITGGTYTYPIIYSLFSTSNPSTPIATHTENDTTKTEHSFTGLATGNYFVRVASSCYSVDQNVSISTNATAPQAIVSDPVVCPMSPTTLGAISATNGLYDITWTDDADSTQTVLATGMPVVLSPANTIKYRATFKLKDLGCANPPVYTSTVDVRVDPNPDVTLAVSDINLCLAPANKTVTISNAQNGYKYELVKSNNDSFIPQITGTGTGSDLVLTIPSTENLAVGTTLKVKTSNGANSKCTDYLTDVVNITQSTPDKTLRVVPGNNVCQGFSSTIKVETSQPQVLYLVKKNGVAIASIPTQTGNGSDLTFTIPANQLVVGANVFTIQASNTSCGTTDLDYNATINVTASPVANAGTPFIKTCIDNPTGKQIGMTGVSGISYSWSPSTGLNEASLPNPIANPTATTTYTLTAADGTCTATSTVKVTVIKTVPSVNAGADFTKTCSVNPSGKLIGTTIQGESVTYSWSPSTGLTGGTTIATPNANPDTTTTYTVTTTETNSGCTSSDEVVVTVDKTPPATPTIASIEHPTCLISTGTITVNATGNTNDSYSIDDGATFQSSNIFNNVSVGTHLVKIKSGTNGCISNATSAIINPQPVTPSVPTITEGSATTFCQGGSVVLTSSATTGNQWFRNGVAISGQASQAYTASEEGAYTVVVTNTDGCSSQISNGINVIVNTAVNPIALSTTIANNCPLETVDLTTIQPAAVSGTVYEWWTGTATSRGTQITNPTTYATPGTIYLWSKSVSEGCYNATAFEVNIVINVCCLPSAGTLLSFDSSVQYAPAEITFLRHRNFPIPSVVRYVIVNDLDGKIKQVNPLKPEFAEIPAGNYTVHALVFGPSVIPTGLVIGNTLSQVQPFCGTSATYSITVTSSDCISNATFSEVIPNAKNYALLNLSTSVFDQINSSGLFTNDYTGTTYQIIGFNYTGTPSGIEIGSNIAAIAATDLDIIPGAVVRGCAAVTTQIDGILFNDKAKNCKEGNQDQNGLPESKIYLKLLNANQDVVQVTSTSSNEGYFYSFSADLLDGQYTIIVDDNDNTLDNISNYPLSWKGNPQSFTLEFGQILEFLSNTANFVPMCMQSATEKPAPRKTSNLQGNTYYFCFDEVATAISVDADSRAEVNWYTSPSGGVASRIAPVPNTKVAGVVTFYVSQTVNGAESERTEIKIEVQPLPDLPSVISGPIVVGSETTQQYSIATSPSMLTYRWTLPSDWIGTSVTEQLNVIVGKQGGTIKVNAISDIGCVGPEQQLDVRVVIEDDIEIYNSISPNGDGVNDELIIRNIDFYPNNTLEIYNRWGVLVYQADGYGQKDVLFKGLSDGRTTMNRNEELPEGTYFYTLMYVNSKGIQRQKAGYLFIKQ